MGYLKEILATISRLEKGFDGERIEEKKMETQRNKFLNLLRDFDLREFDPEERPIEAGSTTEIYIQKLEHSGLPWLQEKYLGFDPMFMVDFKGETEKPNFPGKEGYYQRDKNGPFR